MTSDNDPTWRAATIDVKPLPKRRTVLAVLSPEELARKPIKPKAAFVVKAAQRARAPDAVEATLDLHGLTEAAAHQALLAFIERVAARGARQVLVVTGKGAGLSGALRTNVPRWLEAAPQGRFVSQINVAPPSRGGDGAYIVRLKKPR